MSGTVVVAEIVLSHAGELRAVVSPLTSESFDQIIPSGETWCIRSFIGSAAYLDDTTAALVWDPAGAYEILASTHGDAAADLERNLTGDGVKTLSIILTNDTNTPHLLGASWKGY